MREGVNKAPGAGIKVMELGDFIKYQDKVRKLQNNVLNTTLNQKNQGSPLQRRQGATQARNLIKEAGDNDLVLISENEKGEVDGFLSIRKEDGVASVEQFWVGPAEYGQSSIIEKLIDEALFQLHNGPKQYDKLHMRAISPSGDFKHVCAETERARQLVIKKADNDSGEAQMEEAA
jgi:hypothetical protein